MKLASNDPAESALTIADFQTVTWARLTEVAQARLDSAHRRLEMVQPEVMTNELRGRIAELRFVLSLEEEFHRRLDDMRLHDTADYSLT